MADLRNVVFDVGGVLIDWDPRHLYRGLIDDEAELERFLAEVCTMEWNLTIDAGRSFDEACGELAALHPAQADLVHAWKRQDEMVAGEIPGTAGLVRRLRAERTPLFLLTNMPVDVFASRRARFDVLREFDGAVVSGEEGVLKPSPEIFGRLADRFDLVPGETLFVDDNEGNVDAARAAGFAAHHFVGAPALEAALVDAGLL